MVGKNKMLATCTASEDQLQEIGFLTANKMQDHKSLSLDARSMAEIDMLKKGQL